MALHDNAINRPPSKEYTENIYNMIGMKEEEKQTCFTSARENYKTFHNNKVNMECLVTTASSPAAIPQPAQAHNSRLDGPQCSLFSGVCSEQKAAL
jgi:hypothetical protein